VRSPHVALHANLEVQRVVRLAGVSSGTDRTSHVKPAMPGHGWAPVRSVPAGPVEDVETRWWAPQPARLIATASAAEHRRLIRD
jgi:hypothetical protein